ncbi:MAG: SCP2 sterol-binding domain-containing protein [Candidatus Methanofastidiosia archaeon]
MEKLKYGTLEWWQEFQKRWNSDPEGMKTLKGFGKGVYVVTDRPDLKPIMAYWDEEGKLTEVRYAEPDENPYVTVSAPYDIWKAVYTGELSPTKALMQRKQKIDGPLSAGLKYKKGIDKCNIIGGEIPTEW